MNRAQRSVAGLALLMVVVSACSGSRPETIPASKPGPRSVYVALGNGETAGSGVADQIRDAWPQIVYRNDLPLATVFANFGQTNATTAEAIAHQLPAALRLNPTVATIHLTDDRFGGVTVATFESRLTTLVERLQNGDTTKVVVGNLTPNDREPGVLACLPNPPPNGPECRIGPISDPTVGAQRTAEFNAAIARVTTQTGARLVDLHAAFLAARDRGGEDALWAGNDFSPNERGHALIAQEFGAAVRAVTSSGR